jgi:hypothetical protein
VSGEAAYSNSPLKGIESHVTTVYPCGGGGGGVMLPVSSLCNTFPLKFSGAP